MENNSVQTVSKKWFLILMIFLWGCIVLCGYIVFSIVNINKYNELSNRIDNILISSQKSTVAAKEFLMNAYADESYVKTGTNESFESFNKSLDTVMILTNHFKKSEYIDSKEKKKAASDLDSNLNSYKQVFYEIADLFKQKGFKDLGLEGEMRKAIHFIENHEAPIDLEFLLTLRRDEKDFLLRKDYKYVEKFREDIVKFENHIKSNKGISLESQRSELLTTLEKYSTLFYKIVEIEQKIGLNPKQGLRLHFTSSLSRIENILSTLNKEIKNQKTTASYAINIIIGSIIVVFVLIISAVFFCINYFNNAIVLPIQKLNEAADQIAEGNLSINLDNIRNRKLIKDLVRSYEKLIEKLKFTISQIELISARKISNELELKNNNDEIGKSLNRIILELQTIDMEEKNRVWISEGLAKFGAIVRSNTELKNLSDDIIAFLVKYLNANQGGLFIVKTEGNIEFLSLEAAYAYNRKKYLSKSIEIGEGLVGQCYIERENIYLTEIPEEYLIIGSGLGDANPKSIFIAPMIHNGKVEAIIELASFHKFEKPHIDFITKISEILASSVASTKINKMTTQLLMESKAQSEKMKIQEQEMRNNIEELMTAQEIIAKKEAEFQMEILNLVSENRRQKEKIENLNNVNQSLKNRLNTHEYNLKPDQEYFRSNQNNPLQRYPRRIEQFLDS